jgi:hypothetical protein
MTRSPNPNPGRLMPEGLAASAEHVASVVPDIKSKQYQVLK